jgi:23S rRNA pseudouridine1911/1915/1917 synthase
MIADLEKRIIHEKDGLLVINKPYDLPSTGRKLDDDDCLQYWLMQRHGAMVWAVHQLDADTSGVNLFVTEKSLVKYYKEMLENIQAEKDYLAIVHGVPSWIQCDEHGPIGKVDSRSLGIHPQGKSAHSHFEVLGSIKDLSVIKARIYTGRTHQIRIHLSHLNHSLVGEEWYCEPPCTLHKRQALHCYRIHLPQTDETFTAPLAEDLYQFAHSHGLSQYID